MFTCIWPQAQLPQRPEWSSAAWHRLFWNLKPCDVNELKFVEIQHCCCLASQNLMTYHFLFLKLFPLPHLLVLSNCIRSQTNDSGKPFMLNNIDLWHSKLRYPGRKWFMLYSNLHYYAQQWLLNLTKHWCIHVTNFVRKKAPKFIIFIRHERGYLCKTFQLKNMLRLKTGTF